MAKRSTEPREKAGRPATFEDPVKFQITMERETRRALRALAKKRGEDAAAMLRRFIDEQLASISKK